MICATVEGCMFFSTSLTESCYACFVHKTCEYVRGADAHGYDAYEMPYAGDPIECEASERQRAALFAPLGVTPMAPAEHKWKPTRGKLRSLRATATLPEPELSPEPEPEPEPEQPAVQCSGCYTGTSGPCQQPNGVCSAYQSDDWCVAAGLPVPCCVTGTTACESP